MGKKILFISHYGAMYGANRSLLFLIIDLKNRFQIEPIVLVPFRGAFTDELKNYNIQYIVKPYYPWLEEKITWKSIPKIVVNHLNLRLIYGEINALRIDLIHSNSSVIDIGANLANRLKIPHVWHIREFGKEDYNLKFILGENIAKKKFEKAQLVIAISNAIKEKYVKLFPDTNIKVIYNGVAVNNNYSKKFNYDMPLNFCIVGLLQENKNQFEAIKACEKLIECGMLNFKLYLIGDGSVDYCEKLQSYVKDKKLDGYIKFLGYRENVQEILWTMDIGIMTSKNEAFGRTTVEYMAAQMPVIGTNIGGTKELISHGEDGYLYELGNIDQLANYMREFIIDRKLVKKFGEQAFDSVKNNFSRELNTDKIYSAYSDVMKNI